MLYSSEMEMSQLQSAIEQTLLLTPEQKEEAIDLLPSIPEGEYAQLLENLLKGEAEVVEFGEKEFRLQQQKQKEQQDAYHQKEIHQADQDLVNNFKNI